MPAPKKTIRPRSLHISVREDYLAKIDLLHYSAVEGRVPKGTYQSIITELLGKYLQDNGVEI